MTILRRISAYTLLAAFAVSLAGCLMSSETNTTIKGKNIGPSTFAQIQPGRTKEFVAALLGEPSDRITIDDHTVLWKYKYSEHRTTTGGLIFIFGTSNRTDIEKTSYVEFKDDLVSKAWTE